ncbi:hypothetical protein BH24DEI1_BH24DEI1_07520 [soil metagenome]|jgi:hypothetical protein|nr:hypothetical protein [Deinococcota bacterium]
MRFILRDNETVEAALRQELAKEGLELTDLEGDGDEYAWFASNDETERVKGLMKRVGEGEFEMEYEPISW